MIKEVIKSNDSLYDVLEETLTGLKEPVTALNLMERPKVRAAVLARFGDDVQIATNKLSDRMGFMWRKGVLDKFPSTDPNSIARFAYALKTKVVPRPKALPGALTKATNYALSITENENEVVLDFKQFTIVIRPK